jgi:hypothetical protein
LDISKTELNTAFDLLKKKSTLQTVSTYLERRELPYSANSWPLMYEKRLVPLLQEGRIDRSDILKMLSDAEEYGRQHVFLYTCSKSDASGLVNEGVLEKILAKLDLTELLKKPRIVNRVSGLQLVEARIDKPKRGMRSLVVKAVDVRSSRKLIDKVIDGDRETETYEWEHDRAVNVISVREDGRAEVRIQSHKNALDYEKQANELFAKTTGIIDQIRFRPLSLAKARIALIRKRKEMAYLVRFADNQLRDREGRTFSLATGKRQQELYPEGSASDKSMEAFLSVGIPVCDEIDCFWVVRPNSKVPSVELHTLIQGADNELILTAQCTPMDHEYAVDQIFSLTR